MRRYRDSQIEKVMRCGAEVRLNTPITKEIVDEVKPDVLIAAVGSEPFAVPVPGHDGPNVVFSAYLTPETKLGEKLVVIGDANRAAKIMNATRDAYDVVSALGYM